MAVAMECCDCGGRAASSTPSQQPSHSRLYHPSPYPTHPNKHTPLSLAPSKSVGFVEGKLLENWVVDAVDRLLELCDAAPPLATMRRKLEDTKRGLEFAKEKGMPREALVEVRWDDRKRWA